MIFHVSFVFVKKFFEFCKHDLNKILGEQSLKETTIKLKPMQIRTFEVNLV